jgi:hypothetical protein
MGCISTSHHKLSTIFSLPNTARGRRPISPVQSSEFKKARPIIASPTIVARGVVYPDISP